MSRSLNMTGFWVGQYSYDWPGEPAVSFLANVDEIDLALSGSIDEPNPIGFSSARVGSFIRGSRSERNVEFAKVYDGASDMAHRVDYTGTLSANGLSLAGTWFLEGETGAFRMTREATTQVEDEADAQEAEILTILANEPVQ